MYNKINLSAFIKKLFKYINVTSIIITILVTFNFFEFLKSPILFIIYSFIFNFYYSIIIFIKIILTFIYLITFSTFKYLIFLINGELYCLNLTTKNIFTSYNNLIINCSTISDVMNISMSLFDTVLNQNFNKININNLKLNSNQIIIVLESIRN